MNTHQKNSFKVDPRIAEIPGETYLTENTKQIEPACVPIS
jgi:hypothetical protein